MIYQPETILPGESNELHAGKNYRYRVAINQFDFARLEISPLLNSSSKAMLL